MFNFWLRTFFKDPIGNYFAVHLIILIIDYLFLKKGQEYRKHYPHRNSIVHLLGLFLAADVVC